MMTKEEQKLPEMSFQQLFASARAASNAPHAVSLRINFSLDGCGIERGTLTAIRNPTSRRWLITVGITKDKRYYARLAHGRTVAEVLDRIEQECQGWLI